MQHPENEYVSAGYRYERANTPNAALAQAQRMRNMLELETIADQAEARRLIAQGIAEARQR